MKWLDDVVADWLREAKRFRECAAERQYCGDDEEAILCETEARRLSSCAQQISSALSSAYREDEK